MALKAVVATLEEVAEGMRGLYTKNNDGSFRLDIEGAEDTSQLKGALSKERDRATNYERELAKLRKDFEGVDPVKSREALDRIQALEERRLIDAGEVDKVIAARIAAKEADHANQVNVFKTQLTERDEKLNAANGQLRTLTLDGAIRTLATTKGVRPGAVADAIARMTIVGVGAKDGAPPIKWDYRDGKVVAVRGDEVVYGKDATRPMSLEEGFDILSSEAAHLFGENRGGGAGGNAPGQTMGRDVLLSRDAARDTQVYRAATAQAQKQGGQVLIAQE